MEIRNLTVIGAGTMGSGIAQVLAQYGFLVTLHDLSPALLEQGLKAIHSSLDRQIKKGTLSEAQKKEIFSRLSTTADLKRSVESADMIIEAATENKAVKLQLFRTIDGASPAHALLASNTSSISITELAAVTARPEKVIGMHFMNPVPLMKLVEIIRGLVTSDETFRTVSMLAEKLEKVPVEVRDYPGFVANRILLPMINEAVYCVMEGVAAPESIDTVMKLGMNHPMGPLTLADFIGLDVCLAILDVLHEGLGDPKYRACPLLRKMVAAGHLGRKSGRGFFEYPRSS